QERQEQRIHRIRRSPDIGKMKLEQVLLILAVEKTQAGLTHGGRCGTGRNACELVGVASKAAVRIVEHVEDPRIRLSTVGSWPVEWRPKCAAPLRQFLGSTQSEPDWRRNEDAQGARRGERQALLLSPVTGGNVSSGAGRRRSWQAGVGNQC